MKQKRNNTLHLFVSTGERVIVVVSYILLICLGQSSATDSSNLSFKISFPASVRQQPVTGRAYIIISKKNQPEPRLQVDSFFWGFDAQMFGVDVSQLKPGETGVINGETLGYPLHSLKEIPAGDYYVQGLMNVYTEFHRADGHVILAHMDQWEGQRFNLSPGNLVSKVQKLHLDPAENYDLRLDLTEVLPSVKVPADTDWVKHVKIESKLLSHFWGRPIYLGAVVLLPKGYASHPEINYPIVYNQDHFTDKPPFFFRTDNSRGAEEEGESRGLQTGYEFFQTWNSDQFPRMVVATLLHPTPYYDDSYAVNSANNGPYGDAIMTELIPYLEEHFHVIRKPYARILTGGSTGGWESLALQLLHPDFFGGTWTFYPDSVDLRRFGLVNLYKDANAFTAPDLEWLVRERYALRDEDGQPDVTIRQASQLEMVLGSKGRSGQQLALEAMWGPVGDDGYPEPLWDKATGKIDHEVANYMREHGFDLRYYSETNWSRIGPELVGKLHLYCGDMDNLYSNLAVYLLQDFLEHTKNPYYAGSFEYGRPMKPHGWQPMSNSELLKQIAEHVGKNAPSAESVTSWNYQ